MSKKNRKNNRKADNKAVRIAGITYDYIHNYFYCQCGGRMQWTGGRFAHNHTMETIACTKCGHSVDPRLVMETAVNVLEQWEARKAAYYRQAAMNATVDRNVEKFQSSTVRRSFWSNFNLSGLWSALPTTSLSIA